MTMRRAAALAIVETLAVCSAFGWLALVLGVSWPVAAVCGGWLGFAIGHARLRAAR